MKSKYLALICATLVVWLLPTLAGAADPAPFQPLVGIPGVDANSVLKEGGFGEYINALYRLSISIAALLAVVKIVAAGAKYMLSDIVTHKEDAKKDIEGALIGLLVIIGAVIILNTVNTDLTKNTLMLDPLTVDGSAQTQAVLDQIKKELAEQAAFCAVAGPNCVIDQPCYGPSEACKAYCDSLKGYFNPGTYEGAFIDEDDLGGLLANDANLYHQCTYDKSVVAEEKTKIADANCPDEFSEFGCETEICPPEKGVAICESACEGGVTNVIGLFYSNTYVEETNSCVIPAQIENEDMTCTASIVQTNNDGSILYNYDCAAQLAECADIEGSTATPSADGRSITCSYKFHDGVY